MRISGGVFRGRRILAPKSDCVRPTTGRVREAVFSALGASVQRSRALDLFAGSGAYGLEALSRGAAFVHFVDRDRSVTAGLTRVIKMFGVEDRALVRRNDAVQALREFAESNSLFDLVFLDAPYAGKELARVFSARPFTAALRDGALLVVERSARRATPIESDGLRRCFERKYGETMIEIFSYEEGLLR